MNWLVTLAVILVVINVTEPLELGDDDDEVITIYPHEGEEIDAMRANMTAESDLMRSVVQSGLRAF